MFLYFQMYIQYIIEKIEKERQRRKQEKINTGINRFFRLSLFLSNIHKNQSEHLDIYIHLDENVILCDNMVESVFAVIIRITRPRTKQHGKSLFIKICIQYPLFVS